MADGSNPSPYLTTEELAKLIKYDARTIRNRLKDSVLLEGVHYIRPFGRRKILFLREAIERDIGAYGPDNNDLHPRNERNPENAAGVAAPRAVRRTDDAVPMAAGGVCHV